jgi:hypothetical protein
MTVSKARTAEAFVGNARKNEGMKPEMRAEAVSEHGHLYHTDLC